MPRTSQPEVGKNVQLPFPISVACWVDLLGYGSQISKGNFNPLHPESAKAISRLRRFHRIVAECSLRRFPTLVMNDGAVAYRDLSYRTRWVTYEFLQDSWKMFNAINVAEKNAGEPGARMVIAAGFRVRGRASGNKDVAIQFKDIVTKYSTGKLTLERALGAASQVRSSFDIIPKLQGNFAFTKAYVAEQGGKSEGFKGPNIYVDLSLFKVPAPEWLHIGKPFKWENQRLNLEATFAQLLSLPHGREVVSTADGPIEGGPEGVRSGIEVARVLAGDDDVLRALRNASKPD